jgi:hypothetical protein
MFDLHAETIQERERMKLIRQKRLIITTAVFALFLFTLFTQAIKPVNAQTTSSTTDSSAPIKIQVGAWLVNVEKVDLTANSYRLDFYLWFKFDPSQISLADVRDFEFINGAPTKYEVDSNASYLEYRVRGDFITSFDFTNYPFESHDLNVQLEHNNYDVNSLVYVPDATSNIEQNANVAGWNLQSFKTRVTEHTYGDQTFSRFTFSVTLAKSPVSSFIKSVLPISVITTISLLALFIAPQNFTMRITLAVTTLLAATTFHLSLLSGIPPTGYLTFADKMMISVYALFLYNLASSVYIMHMVDSKKLENAIKIKNKALRFLPVMALIMIILVILL